VIQSGIRTFVYLWFQKLVLPHFIPSWSLRHIDIQDSNFVSLRSSVRSSRSFLGQTPIYAHRLTRAMSTGVEPVTKKQKTQHNSLIGTHDGTFHCDEALAVWLLRRTKTYKDAGSLDHLHPCFMETDIPRPCEDSR
jgi:hypothetical protein